MNLTADGARVIVKQAGTNPHARFGMLMDFVENEIETEATKGFSSVNLAAFDLTSHYDGISRVEEFLDNLLDELSEGGFKVDVHTYAADGGNLIDTIRVSWE